MFKMGFSMDLRVYFIGDARVFQVCLRVILDWFKGNLNVVELCFKGVLWVFQRTFNGGS